MIKRAALARAIMLDPVILLCDEPVSGLDPVSVKRIEELLVRINRQLHITMIVVSHHVASALRFAEHLLILLPDGAVAGTPGELRRSPDLRVAAFLSDECDGIDDTGTPRAGAAARSA